MVTDVYPMATNVYLMVAEEYSVANPQKVAKIDENIRKMQKRWVGNTDFAEELPDSSVLSVVIDVISSHRWDRLIIGYHRWHPLCTRYMFGIQKKTRIESYRHRLRSVTECPRLSKVLLV
jgi:hypothetical protein